MKHSVNLEPKTIHCSKATHVVNAGQVSNAVKAINGLKMNFAAIKKINVVKVIQFLPMQIVVRVKLAV